MTAKMKVNALICIAVAFFALGSATLALTKSRIDCVDVQSAPGAFP